VSEPDAHCKVIARDGQRRILNRLVAMLDLAGICAGEISLLLLRRIATTAGRGGGLVRRGFFFAAALLVGAIVVDEFVFCADTTSPRAGQRRSSRPLLVPERKG